MKFGINNPAWLQAACAKRTSGGGDVDWGTTFRITSLEDDNVISFPCLSNDKISYDGINFITTPATLTLKAGQTIGVRASSKTSTGSYNENPWVRSTKKINIAGNISLAVSSLGSDARFVSAFRESKVVDASGLILPTTLKQYDFMNMFRDSYDLEVPPVLPSNADIPYQCCSSMFMGCSQLKTAPILPATNIDNYAYSYMFQNCTSLETAPDLPATSVKPYAYFSMFAGCTSLVSAPELPATTLGEACYKFMFSGCTSLKIAPNLPATNLSNKNQVYNSMFYGCTSLELAPEIKASTLSGYCFESMFANCTSLVVAPALIATTLTDGCYRNMFAGCTSLESTPVLFDVNMTTASYSGMFNGCTQLRNVICLESSPNSNNMVDWLANVSPTGVFKKAAGSTWSSGASGIPQNWLVEEYSAS